MLLIECRDKEVWTIPYKNKQKVWQEVCDVLKTYPNFESTFAKLNWRKCAQEFERNVQSYSADKDAVLLCTHDY